MSRRFLTIVLALFCIVGGAFSAWIYLNQDRTGPQIKVPETTATYREGDDEATLLDGVTAWDACDGDVSDSLIVEAIYPSADNTSAQVIYAAMDSSNNVSKAERLISYQAEGDGTEETVQTASSLTTTDTDAATDLETAESETESGQDVYDLAVAVINATEATGLATAWQEELEGYGFEDVTAGSSTDTVDKTVICTDNEELAEALQKYFPDADVQNDLPMGESSIDISTALMDACVVIGVEDA